MAVGNGRQAGGNIPVAPDALIDDGLIDVLFISDFNTLDLGTVVSELQDYRNKDNKFVHYLQVESLDMELTKELPINLDGEPYSWDKIHFQVSHDGSPERRSIALGYAKAQFANLEGNVKTM